MTGCLGKDACFTYCFAFDVVKMGAVSSVHPVTLIANKRIEDTTPTYTINIGNHEKS